MRQALRTGTGKSGISSTGIGSRRVSFWDNALHCSAGAATHTSPSAEDARAKARMPGAEMESSFTIRIFIFFT